MFERIIIYERTDWSFNEIKNMEMQESIDNSSETRTIIKALLDEFGGQLED